MTDLPTYVAAWQHSVTAVLALEPTDWDVPSDLPGWTAKDIVAHLVHLERALVVDEGNGPGGAVVPPDYTNAGVEALRGTPIEQLLADLTDLVARRTADLAELPEDASTPAPRSPAGAEWSWDTLLRNRVIDAWMHEQDIRRAVGLPGGLDSPGAHVTTHTFSFALPYVLGKKVAPPTGTVARLIVTGPVAFDSTVGIADDGKARPSTADPDVVLTMDTEAFIIRSGGRRGTEAIDVEIEGDADLGRRVLDAMTVTF